MNDIMLDIETLGTTPGHIVTSFCAVKFDLEKAFDEKNNFEITGRDSSGFPNHVQHHEFYQSISIQSSLKAGLKIDPSTLMWWMTQSDDARQNFMALDHSGSDLTEVLKQFATWLSYYPKPTLWGNGNRFDCGILEAAYTAVGWNAPWITKRERDMCTYIMGYEHLYTSSADRDTIHDPRKDCIYQIQVLQRVYNLKQILHEHFERKSLS